MRDDSRSAAHLINVSHIEFHELSFDIYDLARCDLNLVGDKMQCLGNKTPFSYTTRL